MLNQTLGHFRICEKLGEGGMGVVYLAEDTRLQREVALKLLPPSMAHEPERLRRFEREAQVVASLNHPNIVTLFSVEEADGERFLTMEFVDGQTLDEYVPPAGLATLEVLRLGVQLADAVDAAHQRGIIHRDLKPSNVMVTAEGRVKVLDFGLAKLFAEDSTQLHGLAPDNLTREGHLVGTLTYMSPERLQGRPADARADVFALGVLLYEMATGARPFHGANTADLISAVLRDQPAPPRALRPELLGSLGDVILRCLDKNPDTRTQTAGAVRDALESAARELTSAEFLRSRSVVAALGLGNRRGLLWAGAAVAGILGLTVWVGWGHWPGQSRQPAAPVPVSAASPASSRIPSIAVLPLRNFTGEPEYFVDGMTDGLITALAKLKGARVISRTSAMHYKATALRLPQIATELGVDYIVEGSVERVGDQVHLSVQVVRADPESTVWSDTFTRAFTEVPALQNAVASAASRAAGVRILPAEETRLAAARPIDPEAFQAYLQGKYFLNQFSEEAQRKAQGFFEKAIAEDPQFAPAWVGLSDSLDWLASFHENNPDLFARAETAARRALEIDQNLADAHASLGGLHLNRCAWGMAEKEIRRAVDLDSNSTEAHRRLWMLLACQRRLPEAAAAIERARVLDPLSARVRSEVGIERLFEKRYSEAIVDLRAALNLDPRYAVGHEFLWNVYDALGKDPERGQELRYYIADFANADLLPEFDRALASEGYKQALSGLANRLDATGTGKPSEFSVIAGLLARAGENKKALRWLQRGREQGDWALGWIAVVPDFEPLYDDPDFRALVRELNLPEPPTKGVPPVRD